MESFPCHGLLAESLRKSRLVSQSTILAVAETHMNNLVKITPRTNPQDLNRDLKAFAFALPHIGIPTGVQRVTGSITVNWDLD